MAPCYKLGKMELPAGLIGGPYLSAGHFLPSTDPTNYDEVLLECGKVMVRVCASYQTPTFVFHEHKLLFKEFTH